MLSCNTLYFLFKAHLAETIIGRREFVIIATTLVVTLPLSLYRNVAKLGKVRSSDALKAHIALLSKIEPHFSFVMLNYFRTNQYDEP